MVSELACRTSASATAWWRSCHDRAGTGMLTLVAVAGTRRHPQDRRYGRSQRTDVLRADNRLIGKSR